MITFPIEFSYYGEKYTASVHRIGSGPVQYHVFNLNPSSLSIPNPYVFVVNKKTQQLEWGPDDTYALGRGGPIAKGIFEALKERGIPFDDENY